MYTEDTAAVARREFLRVAVGCAGALGTQPLIAQITATTSTNSASTAATSSQALPSRPLGATGHDVSILGLGGQGALELPGEEAKSEQIIHRALDLGVNYVDTSTFYGKNLSERNLGRVLKTRRGEVFLASKTLDRDYDTSMRNIENSLKQMHTDHLDLWQLHDVRSQECLDRIFSPDGAMLALEKAKAEGMVRFLGITGHGDPLVLKEGIKRFPFDTVLMPVNPAEVYDRPCVSELLPFAVQRKMGIIGMKVTNRGRLLKGALASIQQALRYALSHPVSTIVLGISEVSEIEENVRIAKDFKPFSAQEMAELEQQVKGALKQLLFYKQW